ncbi:MAG: hypothetical protein R3C49_21735 [Planctomycetaceae bacterium]
MKRTVFLDPQTSLFHTRGISPPSEPPNNRFIAAGAPHPESERDLYRVLLASARSFINENGDDADMLAKARFDEWSVRDLSEIFGGHPGTICRRLARTEQRLRIHVLGDAAIWLGRSCFGFTLSPQTATPMAGVDAYAVSIHKHERVVDGEASRDAWMRYLTDKWQALCDPHECKETGELRATYLGGFRCVRTDKTFLDISVLVADRDEAMQIGTTEHQQCIYDLRRGMTIQL